MKEYLDFLYLLRSHHDQEVASLQEINEFDGSDPCCIEIHKLKIENAVRFAAEIDSCISAYIESQQKQSED